MKINEYYSQTAKTLLTTEDFLSLITYRVARTHQELEKAYNLVYREYLQRGYTKPNPHQLKLSIYNALPQTTTFVALIGEDILSTATVIPDSPLGLPMDELYQEELNKFRSKKIRICEISMLASNSELFHKGVSLMLNSKKLLLVFFLFKLIFDYVRDYLSFDYICITINPKHSLTYDFLLFKELGELKSYKSVNNAPAIGKYLDLRSIEEECKKNNRHNLYTIFFETKTSPEQFSAKYLFSQQALKYFFVDKSDVFINAYPNQINYLKICYPDYNFDAIIP
ncbi:MAG: hypothetical protein NC822_05590 [Candidatus Omnitrophica bacterium]|nr:hypothetical protein [Candidatus Omnitrophota bacterium]MCM8826593.1 hypothetical protein [Candidatus Omnitrophota bacterium]